MNHSNKMQQIDNKYFELNKNLVKLNSKFKVRKGELFGLVCRPSLLALFKSTNINFLCNNIFSKYLVQIFHFSLSWLPIISRPGSSSENLDLLTIDVN